MKRSIAICLIRRFQNYEDARMFNKVSGMVIDTFSGYLAIPSVKVCFLVPHMRGGGVEKTVANLVNGLAESGYDVQLLVLSSMSGAYKDSISGAIKITELNLFKPEEKDLPLRKDRSWLTKIKIALSVFPGFFIFLHRYLPSLLRFWEEHKPDIVFCNLYHGEPAFVNIFSRHKAKIVCIEHGYFSTPLFNSMSPSKIFWRRFYSWAYGRADILVAVSGGLLKALIEFRADFEKKSICIYNPVVDKGLKSKALQQCSHPWFYPRKEKPVFFSVGRLADEKDFITLLRAFAKVKDVLDARLLIAGEGPSRRSLEQAAEELGVSDAVQMPGWETNPFMYMAQSDVLVLSSVSEGLPTVLIEALACGTTVVSTSCKHGPEEILENGRYGYLVPVGDVEAMGRSMIYALNNPMDKAILKRRAEDFSFEKSVQAYTQAIKRLMRV